MEKTKKQLEEMLQKYSSAQEECKVQFEQLLGELFLAHMRAEFLAYKYLSKEKYQEMCKNVADFTKKICVNEKKDVTLQSNSESE